MDFRQLRYFVTIVDSGTLTEAARRLHVVQPALSQRLAALEEDMGTQLLVRGRSGLAVTEAGQELYERARVILRQTEAARAAVREKAGGAAGRVGIGLLRSLAPAVGVALFEAIRLALPRVQPDIVVGYSEDLLRMLRATTLDMALGVQHRSDATLEGRLLFHEGVHLIGSPALVTRPQGMRIDDLRGVPLLVSSARGPVHHLIEAAAAKAGFALDIVGSMEDQASVVALCSTGSVATYAPDSTARHLVQRHPALVSAPLLHDALRRQVSLFVHAEVPRTGAMLAVEEILARVVIDATGGG